MGFSGLFWFFWVLDGDVFYVVDLVMVCSSAFFVDFRFQLLAAGRACVYVLV